MAMVTVKNKLNQKITLSILAIDLHQHEELVLGPRETSQPFDKARLSEYTRKMSDLNHVRIDDVLEPVVVPTVSVPAPAPVVAPVVIDTVSQPTADAPKEAKKKA